MRLPLTCMDCVAELREGEHPNLPVWVELRDDNRYEFVCDKGHTTVTTLQQQRFEVLFDIGAYALLDGYYREAVASFTASLERFYEFFIRAKLLEEKVPDEVIDIAWKDVSKQSERQRGAFTLLYTQAFRAAPILLSNTKTEFRNEVIHKGKLPDRDEAIRYGQAVLDVIRPILQLALHTFPAGVRRSVHQHLLSSGQGVPGVRVGTMSMPTILSLNDGDPKHQQRTLVEALQNIGRWKRSYGSATRVATLPPPP